MRQMCGRVLTWFMIGASSLAGAGCGGDPPPKSSPAGGEKGSPKNLELAPGAAGGLNGKAGAPHRLDKKPQEF